MRTTQNPSDPMHRALLETAGYDDPVRGLRNGLLLGLPLWLLLVAVALKGCP